MVCICLSIIYKLYTIIYKKSVLKVVVIPQEARIHHLECRMLYRLYHIIIFQKLFMSLCYTYTCVHVHASQVIPSGYLIPSGRTLDSDKALVFFEELHALLVFFNTILGAIIGIHFQALNDSPLEKYLGIILLFIMATTVYIIAYLEIKLQRQDAAYLFIFRLVCLVSGILSVELLVKCVQLLIIVYCCLFLNSFNTLFIL